MPSSECGIDVPLQPGELPLQSAWTLWWDRTEKTVHVRDADAEPAPPLSDLERQRRTSQAEERVEQRVHAYSSQLKPVATVHSVQGLARVYARVDRPSFLHKDENYHLFRKGTAPTWEASPNGGCWILRVAKRSNLVDRHWEQLLFAAVGELFEEPDVVGVVCSIRAKEDRLSVWNSDNAKGTVKWQIGEKLRALLGLDPESTLEYKNHSTSIKDKSTFRNAKPYVFASPDARRRSSRRSSLRDD